MPASLCHSFGPRGFQADAGCQGNFCNDCRYAATTTDRDWPAEDATKPRAKRQNLRKLICTDGDIDEAPPTMVDSFAGLMSNVSDASEELSDFLGSSTADTLPHHVLEAPIEDKSAGSVEAGISISHRNAENQIHCFLLGGSPYCVCHHCLESFDSCLTWRHPPAVVS